MALNIYLLTASGRLAQYGTLIVQALTGAWADVDGALGLGDLDVVVSHSENVIPETGDAGYASTGYDIQLWLDANRKDAVEVISTRLPRTLAHEAHHSKRWRGPGYGKTLLDALVTEGLAQHFEKELFGYEPVTSFPFAAADAEKVRDRLKRDMASSGYSHDVWFLSRGDESMPKWAGYRIGYAVVQHYLNLHLDQTACSLAEVPSSAFEMSMQTFVRKIDG